MSEIVLMSDIKIIEALNMSASAEIKNHLIGNEENKQINHREVNQHQKNGAVNANLNIDNSTSPMSNYLEHDIRICAYFLVIVCIIVLVYKFMQYYRKRVISQHRGMQSPQPLLPVTQQQSLYPLLPMTTYEATAPPPTVEKIVTKK